MREPYTNGDLSVVVPMEDMKVILLQLWKSRKSEKKMKVCKTVADFAVQVL